MSKSPKLFFLIVIFFQTFAASACFGQNKDLSITADKVVYDKDDQQMEATGSVEAAYNNFLFQGNHLIYNASGESLFADQGFTFYMKESGITFEGSKLSYSINDTTGEAEKINFTYRGMMLQGEKMTIRPEKYNLKQANFTTCDLSPPHYHVSALDVSIFPESEWLVASWGVFWLGGVPLVPMPTYIYDFSPGVRADKNLPPFPEIGRNEDDGSYINERLSWYLNSKLNGSYSLGYAANKGILLGAMGNYIFNKQSSGNVRINVNLKDGVFGGITHFNKLQNDACQLATTISFKERINYQRVDFTPDFELDFSNQALSWQDLKYNFLAKLGMVAEAGNTRAARGGGDLKLYKVFSHTPVGDIVPFLDADFQYYSNGSRWEKPSIGIDISKPLNEDMSLFAGYSRFLFINGASPFNYELYRYRPADKLKGSLSFKIGETKSILSASYFLDNWSAEDIDCALFFKLHCYNLKVTYRTMRGDFALGVSLAE